MHFPESSHAIWNIIRTGVVMTGLYFILQANASNFDATEMRTLVEFALLLVAAETASRWGGKSEPKVEQKREP